MAMLAITYSLPPQQKSFLDREASRRGITAAEYLRRIIDREEERLSLVRHEQTDGRG